MRSQLIAALFGVAGFVAPASHEFQAPSDLKPLEFLVGSCWTGTFADGKQTDEHCFEWMLDKQFIRDRHIVRNGPGPYSGETIYSWDAATKQIVFSYYSSAGFVLAGSVQSMTDSIAFPSKMPTPQGPMELRPVWTRRGADSYHVVDMQKTPAGWKVTRETDYHRKK